MIVSLFRFGGHLPKQSPVVIDTAVLTPKEARELAALLNDAKSAASSPKRRSEPMPDMMSYSITVESDGSTRTLKANDQAMDESFSRLLEWLEGHRRL